MTIWVDADSCPSAIKDILVRAAKRTNTRTIFVANRFIPLPNLPNLQSKQVTAGFDIADNEIVSSIESDDLVITNDIPLAAEVIDKKAFALGHRGFEFTRENVKARLNMRDFMETMRSSGIQSSGPSALKQTDIQKFANALDRYLAKRPNVNK